MGTQYSHFMHELGSIVLEVQTTRKPGGDRGGRGTREAPRLLARGMDQAGMVGTFRMQTTTQMKQRNQNRYMHFVRMQHEIKAARITLKPGDNGTCWEWLVKPPQFYDLGKFERQMKKVEAILNGQPSADDLLDALGKTPPTEPVPVPADALGDDDFEAAFRRADGMLDVEDEINRRATGAAKIAVEVARQALLNKGKAAAEKAAAEHAAVEKADAKQAVSEKPDSTPPPVQPQPAPTAFDLAKQLSRVQEIAGPYIARRDSIAAKRRELESMMEAMALLEAATVELERLHALDTNGAEAAKLVDSLSKLAL